MPLYSTEYYWLMWIWFTDVDECALGIYMCDSDDQACHNEPGSYSCVNPDGSVAKPFFRETDKGNHFILLIYFSSYILL